jgi:dTDP-4-amino-4,6-dideoxygalactose transaminase
MTQSTVASLPFLPFVKPEIDEETIQGVADVLRSGWITTGPQNQKFEAALSEFCGGRPVRTFNSGTATLEIGLRIAGVGEGDEVITTPASWVSTSNVIYEVGATPVFADIDPVTRNIDLDKLEQAITPRRRSARHGTASASARSATWSRSAFTRTRTSRRSKAARSC